MQKDKKQWLLFLVRLFMLHEKKAFTYYIGHSRTLGAKEKFLCHPFHFKKVPRRGTRSFIAWRGKKTPLEGSVKMNLLEIKEEVKEELLGKLLLILANESIKDSAEIKKKNRNNIWAWESEESLPSNTHTEFMELLKLVAPEIYNVSTAPASDPIEELLAA